MSDELSVDACRHCCRLLPTEGYDLPHVKPVVLQLGWYVVQEWGVRSLQATKLDTDYVWKSCVNHIHANQKDRCMLACQTFKLMCRDIQPMHAT